MAKETEVTVACTKKPKMPRFSRRIADVSLKFGIPAEPMPTKILDELRLKIAPGRIIALIGPSGSGKTTALQLIARKWHNVIDVNRLNIPTDKSLIDSICPHQPLTNALELLNACGLGDTSVWLRTGDEISAGQSFRAKLARGIGMALKSGQSPMLICDEFCSGLHERLTAAVSHNLRKLVTRHNLTIIVAGCNKKLLTDLQPDITVKFTGKGEHETTTAEPRAKQVSLTRKLIIEPGTKSDYDAFAADHYRKTDELGFVDKVFRMKERSTGDILGVVVYAHGPLELALRNQATDKRFTRNPDKLNKEMRILRRLVVHADVRGCGLGAWLVKKTLPEVGTPYVECLASMGEVNPVFEKAGMTRIGTCALPKDRAKLVEKVTELGADPFAPDFVKQVARKPAIRRIVAQMVYNWYQATTGGGERRVRRQSTERLTQTFRGLIGSTPVYYLWQKNAKVKTTTRVSTPSNHGARQ